MYCLKWSNGESYEKSPRQKNVNLEDIKSEMTPETIMTHNKREIANHKIIERGMYSQTSQNPFLTNHKYLDDINIQETFLRPKNSNFEEDNLNSKK
jgi:hypothetical protein